MIDRIVRGNTTFLRSAKCELHIIQISSAKILLKLIGNDTGDLGRIPFDELTDRFKSGEKLELFIDTSQAKGAAISVTDQWEKWFTAHRSNLKAVHLYAPEKFFLIMGGMIKELSRFGDLFHVYSEVENFQQRLGYAPTYKTIAPANYGSDLRQQYFEGALSAFRLLHLRPGVLFIKISGRDTGETIPQVLSTLSNEIKSFPGPLQLFVDASETRGVSSEVRDEWTKWISENRKKLSSIDVLTGSRLVTLIVSAAKIFSRTGDLMNVLDSRQTFVEKLEMAAPGSEKIIAQQ